MASQRIVIKLGTSVVSGGTDRLYRPALVEIIRQCATLFHEGHQPVLVTSGAVLAGWEAMGFPPRKKTVAEKQFFAAIGQSRLMRSYGEIADIYGVVLAQCLLIRDDFRDRRRYLNARTTLLNCLGQGVLPIINENDVVAFDEIKVGDNDTLAARVAAMIDADKLILCSDISGLLDSDPRENIQAKLIPEVHEITESIIQLAGGEGSHRGTGGMRTKIQAAELATVSGVTMFIVHGHLSDVVLRIVAGENPGTRFHPVATPIDAKRRWILSDIRNDNSLVIDLGAASALKEGRSLLSIGVCHSAGKYERGDTVRILDVQKKLVGHGQIQYSHVEMEKIIGCHSEDIEGILGYSNGEVIIKIDDFVDGFL